VVVEGQ
jgi:hypothetical protein